MSCDEREVIAREYERECAVCGARVFSAHADGIVYCAAPECLTAPVPFDHAPRVGLD